MRLETRRATLIKTLRDMLNTYDQEKNQLDIPARIERVNDIFDLLVDNKWFLEQHPQLRLTVYNKLLYFKQYWYYVERANYYLLVLFGEA